MIISFVKNRFQLVNLTKQSLSNSIKTFDFNGLFNNINMDDLNKVINIFFKSPKS